MKAMEKPLFTILMSIFFIVSLILSVKPVWGLNLYKNISRVFGFEIKFGSKAVTVTRSVGIIMFVWGLIVVWLSNRR